VSLPPAVEERARRLVLENAVAHDGHARVDPIVARLLATDASLRPQAADVRELVSMIVAEARGVPSKELEDRLIGLGGPERATPRPPEAVGGEFPDLPGAEPGRVVLRLAPFPSGALHVGHGRMLFVNQHYKERYGGKLLLVFDDTVGSEEKRVATEFFDMIQQDCASAGIVPDATYYKSDRVASFYPWARRVIDKGAAYVCHCHPDLLRENRARGNACPERSQTIDETVDEWERMLGGSYNPGEAVLRLKTDLADPDPAFRDRVMFRISDIDHPRVGHKYRVWPMLEFSWAVDDVELGITHVLRGKDLVIEDRMQRYVWDLLGVKGPPFLHWGILRLREAKISKSKSYREVTSGQFDGWADPRTWSLRSLDRRGISMDAFRAFTLSFGLSLADVEVPAETLYAENRKRIDATTVRRSFVTEPVRVEVEEYPTDLASVELANHPDRPELGRRIVRAGPSFYLARKDLEARGGVEVRLKDLINIELPAGAAVGSAPLRARFTGRENKRVPRLQWVGAEEAVPVDVLGVEGEHAGGLGEGALLSAAPGEIFQFERVGFVRVERDAVPGATPIRVVFGHP
jgi:glutamyl-tRNA synthetase